MNLMERIDFLASKIRPALTVNLLKMLAEIDGQIALKKSAAQQSGDFTDVQAMNEIRTAIIDVLDERDPGLFDDYFAGRGEVSAQ